MEEKELKSIITREGVNLGVNESGQDINAEKNTSLVQVGASSCFSRHQDSTKSIQKFFETHVNQEWKSSLYGTDLRV